MNDPRPPLATAGAADVAARVASTIRPDVRAMRSYAVAKADGLIKLDANENPHPLPPALHDRLAHAMAKLAVNRYPDGPADEARAALRRSLALPPGVELVLGNGSDELIQIVTTAVAQPGATVLAPAPTFVMYSIYAQLAHVRYVGVPLHPDFTLDSGAMLAAIAREKPALVWLASPNNPTGTGFDPRAIERVIRAAPGLVVVDEAYAAFADTSWLPRVLDFPNLVVLRTLSKIGMAGLRLGYAVGHPAWIAEFDKVRSPYNLNSLTQAAAVALLESDEVFAGQAGAVRAERARLAAALAGKPGVTVFASQANFVLARVPHAARWFGALRDAGILVKNVHGTHPLLDNCLRITVGTTAEIDALLAALEPLQ
jgi:histidinol-phosphate aminotransferase